MWENSHNAFGYIPNHLKEYNKNADIDGVKSILAKIQDDGENADKEDEDE
jgi:hypothetical protein